MNKAVDFKGLEVGYDIPALPGMDEADIQTPCLVLDLDALERNIKKMGDAAKAMGVRHRIHGNRDELLAREAARSSAADTASRSSSNRSE